MTWPGTRDQRQGEFRCRSSVGELLAANAEGAGTATLIACSADDFEAAVRATDQFATSDGGSSGRVMPDPFRLPMICAPIFVTGQPVWFDRITVPLPFDGVKIMNEV